MGPAAADADIAGAQETLAARNELLEKFLAMQQEGQQQPEQEAMGGGAAGASSNSFGPGNADDAGVRAAACIGICKWTKSGVGHDCGSFRGGLTNTPSAIFGSTSTHGTGLLLHAAFASAPLHDHATLVELCLVTWPVTPCRQDHLVAVPAADDAAWWLDDRTKRLIEHGLDLEEAWTVTVAGGAGIPSRLSRQKVSCAPKARSRCCVVSVRGVGSVLI